MNDKHLGPLQKECLQHYNSDKKQYWLTYHKDYRTKRVISSLVNRGLLEINEFGQARRTNKVRRPF